jgi:hypothetical protein
MMSTALRYVLLIALISVVSCGSIGRRTFEPDAYYRPPYYPEPRPYGVLDPYDESTRFNNYDPLVRFPADTRLAPSPASNLLSRHLSEFAGTFGGNFAQLHQRLPYGYSNAALDAYLMASPNAYVSRDAEDPRKVSVNLVSDVNTVSFVTYGLLSEAARQQVLSVEVFGRASFALGRENGLYIGVRQFAEPRYQWYGPFKSAEQWRAVAERDSNFADGNAAYITLAVFNGDSISVDGLAIELGG